MCKSGTSACVNTYRVMCINFETMFPKMLNMKPWVKRIQLFLGEKMRLNHICSKRETYYWTFERSCARL